MRDPGSVMRPRTGVFVAFALIALLGACSGSTDGEASGAPTTTESSTGSPDASTPLPQPVQQLNINATEYKFDIDPDPSGGLKPGWTLIEFHNIGSEAHQIMFARMKDGVDMSQLAAAGANDSSGAGAIEFVDMLGGVSYIGPHQRTTALVNLPEGTVLAMCYVPDAKGVAHALMGMSTTLTVSADAAAPPEREPGDEKVLGTIELAEDGYRLPVHLGAGWYHLKNTDSALHELSLLRLGASIDDDRTSSLVADLAANRTPPVELEAVGGMGAISSGFDGYLYLDLSDGEYIAVDFMPDPGDPRPHMLDGYYRVFTV